MACDASPQVPANTTFTALALSSDHSCALTDNGRAYCWGANEARQSSPPSREKFAAIDTSLEYGCGIRESDGTAVCWGSNYGGRASPPSDQRFTAIGVGQYHVCALRPEGRPRNVGDIANLPMERHPHPMSASLKSEAGEATAVGCERTAKSSAGAEGFPPVATRTLEGERFSTISVGSEQACGIRFDGTGVCLGGYPHRAPRDERFSAVSTDSGHSCGLRLDGTVICWGGGGLRRPTLTTVGS